MAKRGRPLSYKSKIVIEYLEIYPKATTNAIARMLHSDYPIDFPNFDSARYHVRNHRGEFGRGLKSIDTSKHHRTHKERKQAMAHFNLPESDYEKVKPFVIPKGNNNILMLSDVHIPYQDNKALELALEYGLKQKVNAIYLNGDTMDCYMISRFIKDRRMRNIESELELTREFLSTLQSTFNCPIYFKIGNHEERWENFLKLNAPELFGIPDFELRNVLRFGQYGVQEIKSKQFTYAGKLPLLHGHEFGFSIFSPVNAARGLFLRAKESAVIGHHHQTSEHTEKNLTGDITTTWSVGALCGLEPEYMPFNKWNHGFAHIRVKDNGNYTVDNLRIINYKIV